MGMHKMLMFMYEFRCGSMVLKVCRILGRKGCGYFFGECESAGFKYGVAFRSLLIYWEGCPDFAGYIEMTKGNPPMW